MKEDEVSGWRHIKNPHFSFADLCSWDGDQWPCDAEQKRIDLDAALARIASLEKALRWFIDYTPKTWDDDLHGCRFCLSPTIDHAPDCGYVAARSALEASEPTACPECGGHGWVESIDAEPLPSGEPGEPYQVQETCPACGGAGTLALASAVPTEPTDIPASVRVLGYTIDQLRVAVATASLHDPAWVNRASAVPEITGPVMSDQPPMTNDEAQEWLLSLLNRLPDAASYAGTFGAAIRAIRAKAIADAKRWYGSAGPEPTDGLDVERLERAMTACFDIYGWDLATMAREIAAEYAATPPGPHSESPEPGAA